MWGRNSETTCGVCLFVTSTMRYQKSLDYGDAVQCTLHLSTGRKKKKKQEIETRHFSSQKTLLSYLNLQCNGETDLFKGKLSLLFFLFFASLSNNQKPENKNKKFCFHFWLQRFDLYAYSFNLYFLSENFEGKKFLQNNHPSHKTLTRTMLGKDWGCQKKWKLTERWKRRDRENR